MAAAPLQGSVVELCEHRGPPQNQWRPPDVSPCAEVSLGVSAGRLVRAGLWVSDRGLGHAHSPLCRVRRPPDSTPRGRVPVGVSPFSCSTLSFSSLQTQHHHPHTPSSSAQAKASSFFHLLKHAAKQRLVIFSKLYICKQEFL